MTTKHTPTLERLTDEKYLSGLPIWSDCEENLENICNLLGIPQTDKLEPTQEDLVDFIKANAEHIVTAVNAHEELIELLKRFIDPNGDCPTDKEVMDTLKKAGAL